MTEPAETKLASLPAISSEHCALCDEAMAGEGSVSLAMPVHRVCALRNVVGGIGHLLDHEHFCVGLHDPDAGLDYRTSALLVDAYVRRKGVVS